MIKQNILAQRPSDLTLEWAQRVVNRRLDEVVVSGINILSIDIGTTTRVRLMVEHNGPPHLPRRLVCEVSFAGLACEADYGFAKVVA